MRTLSHCYEILSQPFGIDLPKGINRFAVERKVKPLIMFQDLMSLMNSLVYCIFATEFNFTHNDWTNVLNAATGWNMTYEDSMRVGERIWNLQKLFNPREGACRKDDTLPPRIMKHASIPFPDRRSRAVDNLEPMIDDYYERRGWDEQAQPTKQKLAELGLYKKKTTTKRPTKRAHTRKRK